MFQSVNLQRFCLLLVIFCIYVCNIYVIIMPNLLYLVMSVHVVAFCSNTTLSWCFAVVFTYMGSQNWEGQGRVRQFCCWSEKINVLSELFGCCCITKENRKSNKEEMLACNPTVHCLNQNSDRKDMKSSQNYLKCITLIPVRVGCELLRYACLYTFVCLSAGMSQHEVSSCWDGRPFGHNRHGPKEGRWWVPI